LWAAGLHGASERRVAAARGAPLAARLQSPSRSAAVSWPARSAHLSRAPRGYDPRKTVTVPGV
jgi:hypothetical protein